MASLNITATSLSKFVHVGEVVAKRNVWSSRVFLASSPRSIQASSHQEASTVCAKTTEAVKQGTDEAMKAGENMKDKVAYSAGQIDQKTKKMAGKVSDTAQDVTEKAKQTMKDAWGSAKETAQKAKDTVQGKADDSKAYVKENAETVRKSMNTKN